MSECFDRQYIQRVTAIQLDECGRIPTIGEVPAPAIKGLADALQTIQFTRNVDVPQQVVNKKVNGGNCAKPLQTPTDRGVTTQITFCGANPVFESVTGYKLLDMAGSLVTGWEDVEISTNARVALEIIYKPTAGSCSGGTVQCYGQLIPMIMQWQRGGDETYNGNDTPDLVMTGVQQLNSHLFDNYASGSLPTYLAHWQPKYAQFALGRSFSISRLITCPAEVVEDACLLVAL